MESPNLQSPKHTTLENGTEGELHLLSSYQKEFACCPTHCVSVTSNPVRSSLLGHPIDSGMGLSITIDKLREKGSKEKEI